MRLIDNTLPCRCKARISCCSGAFGGTNCVCGCIWSRCGSAMHHYHHFARVGTLCED
ncbi:hypothetical protein KCP69_13165 [Salmonella enterica subsp. enterica]|nr:hypothetical protein KCP69_13165 [Salmonella enterica subsp. enterica]